MPISGFDVKPLPTVSSATVTFGFRADEVKEMEYQFASLNAALSEITSDVNAMSERLHELTDSLERLRGNADAKRA